MSNSKAFDFGPTEKLGNIKSGGTAAVLEAPSKTQTQPPQPVQPVKTINTLKGEVIQPNAPQTIQPQNTTETTQTATPAPKKRGRPVKIKVESIMSETPEVPTIPKTPREEFVEEAMKKAGITQLPEFASLFEGKQNLTKIKLSDIAVFTQETNRDEVLHTLQLLWKSVNTLHRSAEVNAKRAFDIAVLILEAAKVYLSIEVTRLPDGKLEASSGRHRLIALALLYGMDIEVPVVISDYSLGNARDAVIVANQTRRIGSLEKAEHRVLGHVHSDTEIEREQLYKTAVRKKGDVAEYAAYSTFVSHEYGTRLKFKVSQDSTRSSGALTTITGIKGFWKRALIWDSTMTRKEFDDNLRESCNFLNSLVEVMEPLKGFDSKQHLASMVLVAIGQIFRHMKDGNNNPIDSVKKLAKAIVDAGEIARQKSEKTYREILKVVNI